MMEHIRSSFKGCNNCELSYQCWLPSEEVEAVLIVVHGLAEHCGRYTNLVNYFIPKGYAIYSYDQQGHGKSQGMPGHIEQFSYFIKDLETFSGMVHDKHKEAKIFLIGHSVGGLIAATFIIDNQDKFDGLILSGATIKPGSSVSSGMILAARLLSFLLPKLGVETIDASAISKDDSVVNAYINDPLVYQGKIRARLGAELIKAMQKLAGNMANINLPVLIMFGSSDRLSNPEGSLLLYEKIGSKDKTLKIYDGFYHEIFNEPGNIEVLTDTDIWLVSHK